MFGLDDEEKGMRACERKGGGGGCNESIVDRLGIGLSRKKSGTGQTSIS